MCQRKREWVERVAVADPIIGILERGSVSLIWCHCTHFMPIKEYIKLIWGGMIELGADTFYEVYVPDDPEFSPYGDRKINSLCHAWSCTPSYFIRKYFI